MVLPFFCCSGVDLEHAADDERALDVAAVQRLLLEADLARGSAATSAPRGARGHVGSSRSHDTWRAHQISIPNCC